MNLSKWLVTSLALTFSVSCQDEHQLSADSEDSTAPAVELNSQSYEVRYGQDDGDQHPSVVKLLMRVGGAYYLCSGSVIAEDAVLTAAHCVDQIAAPSDVTVLYDGGSLTPDEVIIHEHYSTSAPHIRFTEGDYYRFSSADVAILKFDQFIPLPVIPIGQPPELRGEMMTVVGYGNNENMSSGVRRNGQVEFVATAETYLSDKATADLEDGSILINPGPTNQTVCGGDSGGALIYQGQLVGVTSGGVINYGSGNQCVLSRNANFISAPAYLGWVEAHVNLPSDESPEPEDPKDEEPQPEDEEPQPEDEEPQPEDEEPQPEDEEPQPEDEEPQPEDEEPQPEDEEPQPEDEEPQPEDEEPQPEDEEPQPEENQQYVGEYGQLQLTHEWQTVQLEGSYEAPVILVSDPQTSELIATARLRHVESSSFEVRLQSPNYLSDADSQRAGHASYMVIESGDWVLGGGARISAGRIASAKLSPQGWSRVRLNHFEETPAVLTQVQSYAGQDWVVTRIRRQSARAFEVTMQEEEALNRGEHQQETIGWVAMSQGRAQGEGVLVEAHTTERVYTHREGRVALQGAMDQPTIIAKLGSTFGSDTANTRVVSVDDEGFDVSVAEEQSRDRETRHISEMLSYFAFAGESGVISADAWHDLPRDPLGEYGQVAIDGAWHTVMLQGEYQAPVVVFSEPSIQGVTPVVVRLREVSAGSFQARLEGLDTPSSELLPDVVSFLVVESGDWTTRTGARIVAGTHRSSRLSRQGWESISFESFDQTPVALTQIQTSAEAGWTVTRMRGQRRDRFRFTMQESERDNRGSHAEESIGYILIDAGDYQHADQRILSANTSRSYTHRVGAVAFDQPFESAPCVIAKLGSTFGGDSAHVRISDVDIQGFSVKVAEEQSRDREMNHTREQVSYVALPSSSGVID